MDKTAVKNLFTLEDVLSELLASQKKLGALLERQRQALAKGDASALSDLCREEQAFIDQIRGLERRCLELVAAVGQSFKRPSHSEK
ncbi:MAG: flagellar export chaperone FlgN, partial [Algisphaera sp.]